MHANVFDVCSTRGSITRAWARSLLIESDSKVVSSSTSAHVMLITEKICGNRILNYFVVSLGLGLFISKASLDRNLRRWRLHTHPSINLKHNRREQKKIKAMQIDTVSNYPPRMNQKSTWQTHTSTMAGKFDKNVYWSEGRKKTKGGSERIFKIDISNTLRGCVAKVTHERQTIPLKVL